MLLRLQQHLMPFSRGLIYYTRPRRLKSTCNLFLFPSSPFNLILLPACISVFLLWKFFRRCYKPALGMRVLWIELCPSPYSSVEALTPNAMAFGDGALGG